LFRDGMPIGRYEGCVVHELRPNCWTTRFSRRGERSMVYYNIRVGARLGRTGTWIHKVLAAERDLLLARDRTQTPMMRGRSSTYPRVISILGISPNRTRVGADSEGLEGWEAGTRRSTTGRCSGRREAIVVAGFGATVAPRIKDGRLTCELGSSGRPRGRPLIAIACRSAPVQAISLAKPFCRSRRPAIPGCRKEDHIVCSSAADNLRLARCGSDGAGT